MAARTWTKRMFHYKQRTYRITFLSGLITDIDQKVKSPHNVGFWRRLNWDRRQKIIEAYQEFLRGEAANTTTAD